jgi:hypothetical protein
MHEGLQHARRIARRGELLFGLWTNQERPGSRQAIPRSLFPSLASIFSSFVHHSSQQFGLYDKPLSVTSDIQDHLEHHSKLMEVQDDLEPPPATLSWRAFVKTSRRRYSIEASLKSIAAYSKAISLGLFPRSRSFAFISSGSPESFSLILLSVSS